LLIELVVNRWCRESADAAAAPATFHQIFLNPVEGLPEAGSRVGVSAGAIRVVQAIFPLPAVLKRRVLCGLAVAQGECICREVCHLAARQLALIEEVVLLGKKRHLVAERCCRLQEVVHIDSTVVDFHLSEELTANESVKAGKNLQAQRQASGGGAIVRIEQDEFWCSLTVDGGEITVLEANEVLLESASFSFVAASELDAARSIPSLLKRGDDLLGGDEPITVAAGRCCVSCLQRSVERRDDFGVECWYGGFHFSGFFYGCRFRSCEVSGRQEECLWQMPHADL
jgi:hypothetical protein